MCKYNLRSVYFGSVLIICCKAHLYLFVGFIPVRNAELGEGIGPIFLDQLMCNGSEASLLECLPSENIGLHNCNHNEDAGVRCEGLLFDVLEECTLHI